MKKKNLLIFFMSIFILIIAVIKPLDTSSSDKEIHTLFLNKQEDNWTINELSNSLVKFDDDYIDLYFEGLDDNQVILALKGGGFTTKSGYFKNNHAGIDPLVGIGVGDDEKSVYQSLDSKDATTVGEAKQALKDLNNIK